MNYRLFTTILLVIFQLIAVAQISTNGIPVSFNGKLNTKIKSTEVANIVPEQKNEVSKDPTQAGYTIPFEYNISDIGSWEKNNDILIWRLEIVVPNAFAINLYLDNIHLLPGDKLYLYNNQKDFTLGAFTDFNNGLFMSTDFIPGSKLIIELNSRSRYKQLPFSIHEVGVLFKPDNTRGFGNAGTCEVHINCMEGENWQYEKDGVARVLVKQNNNTFWCTGSLINNTKNDGTPYFLTANHCGEYADSTDYAQWLFYFNYESQDCEQPVFEPELHSLSGADMLAHATSGTTTGSDFKLLLLKNNVPSNYKPYYNGWDIKGEASQNGVTIHHPQGDLKMISTYESALISTKYNSQTQDPDGNYWMVKWAKTTSGHGVTEGGSSGSPIFSNNGYIVGALTGGFASCANLDAPDYYGKLSHSWESGNDSTEQLKYWLDPTGSGITSLKGNNLDSTNIFAAFSGEPKSIIMGESVTFINTSYGNITSYSWYFEGGIPEYYEGEEPGSVKYNTAGEFDVQLIVTAADGVDTLFTKNYIQVLPNISPNPTDGKIKLAFGNTLPDDIENKIRVSNSIGQETGFRIIEKNNNYLIIEITPNGNGLYLIKVTSEEVNNTFKVIVN